MGDIIEVDEDTIAVLDSAETGLTVGLRPVGIGFADISLLANVFALTVDSGKQILAFAILH